MTPWLIKALIIEYLVIVVFAAVEQRWPWVLYFSGATAISLAILWMGDAR